MLKNKLILVFLVLVAIGLGLFFIQKNKDKQDKTASFKEVTAFIGDIKNTVSTTGMIEPQNRLEIKSSISGRIEEILVKEGDKVKKGDVLINMSSTERAALVDAARAQGEATLDYWQDVYKESPIISPIDGEVIVRSVEPGQTITTSDTVLVLSDRLIVNAQFDETDIRKVKLGQEALITLDAYPDVQIEGVVDHIAYESKVVNNVTTYDVDIVPSIVPNFFRSGMSTNVEVIEQEHKDAVLIPVEALIEEQNGTFVNIKESNGSIKKNAVVIGLKDDKNAEVISGISAGDLIVVKVQNFSLKNKESVGSNPFLPSRRR